jgi:uncharacterized membrane protein YhhN
LIFILTPLVILSASILIRAEYRGPKLNVYIFKPLTMVFILLIATLSKGFTPFYKYMVITGLVFSLAGDICLMLPSDRFLTGLIAFLFAHLAYIAAFVSQISALIWWPFIPLIVWAVAIYRILAPSLGKLKLPVLIYMLVIMTMTWFAWERWIHLDHTGALLAAFGAVLFTISDSILAINRFRVEFKLARALNLSIYFAAQWLIAISV